jgi:hypothetical protein
MEKFNLKLIFTCQNKSVITNQKRIPRFQITNNTELNNIENGRQIF